MKRFLLSEEERKKDLLELFKKYNVSFELFPYEWLCKTDFFRAPASKGHHAAYPGGLYDHCRNVTIMLLDWSEKLVTDTWSRQESPIIIGMLHDVTKIHMYALRQEMNPLKNEIEAFYVKNPQYNGFGGHGYDSVCKVEQHMELTEEERLCIRYHMGAYETSDWDGYDAAIRKFPNVLWTHTADMFASKLMED
nr:MAG TPA: Putative helicase [Caudoviricetes sp.]